MPPPPAPPPEVPPVVEPPRRALLLRVLLRAVLLRVFERVELALVLRAAGFLRVVFLRAPVVLRVPAVLLRAAPVLLFAALLRLVLLRAVDFFRAPPVAARLVPVDLARLAELARAVPPSSSDHLPANTRCAASATASAINAPSLLALDITLVAACDAESAASSPASRILRRAAGLALIAAAAAASPAPSISRLIAALAILSTVDFLDREDDLDERFFVLDFAICKASLCNERKTLQARNGSRRAT